MENFWSFYSKEFKEPKKGVDLSSCFLVEASGDSEIDFDPNNNNKPSKDLEAGDDDDDNDAESCCCNVSYCCYYSCFGNFDGCEVEESSALVINSDNNNNDKKKRKKKNQETEQKQRKEDEEEEDEVNGYQEWGDGGNALPVNQKSCVSVESTNEPMNEMEKSRLFWETCLAS